LVYPGKYNAWLFDLDGVITDTASVHAAAWKSTFDRYLKEVSERAGKPFEPFEINPDYYRYVDGKPRYDGVDSFLRSRGIVLEWGTPTILRTERPCAVSESVRTECSMRF
jgi:beta-phosphoglucomutase-like phosphatase (HAD superfamily)